MKIINKKSEFEEFFKEDVPVGACYSAEDGLEQEARLMANTLSRYGSILFQPDSTKDLPAIDDTHMEKLMTISRNLRGEGADAGAPEKPILEHPETPVKRNKPALMIWLKLAPVAAAIVLGCFFLLRDPMTNDVRVINGTPKDSLLNHNFRGEGSAFSMDQLLSGIRENVGDRKVLNVRRPLSGAATNYPSDILDAGSERYVVLIQEDIQADDLIVRVGLFDRKKRIKVAEKVLAVDGEENVRKRVNELCRALLAELN